MSRNRTKPLPDRLSLDPRSPHFDEDVLQPRRRHPLQRSGKDQRRGILHFRRLDPDVAAGRSRDRHGNPMTLKMKGKVEPYYQEAPAGDAEPETDAE